MCKKRPDPSSAVNADAAVVRHIDLDLEVDFEARRVRGAATLTVERLQPACTEVVLDVHMLEIEKVGLLRSDAAAEPTPVTDYRVEAFSAYGSALHVPLPAAEGDCRVRIEYQTSPESPSLDWMAPSQTAGKQLSFLFTQGQSVLNRSFFPCQDSCSVRITYSARVIVPAPYVALMSAARLSPDAGELGAGEGKRVYRFEMTRSIPAYLVALAVGDLVSAEIGPRSRVWAEPAMLAAATAEFEWRMTAMVLGAEYTALEALAGWDGLLADIREFGADSKLTRLRVPLEGPGDDPEDVYNDVPYEKGYAFVSYLRSLAGSDAAFDGWMKQYVAHFAFKSITSEEMLAHFLHHFPDLAAQGVAQRAGFEFVETWLDAPGPPPFVPDHSPAKPLTDAADALIAQVVTYARGGGGGDQETPLLFSSDKKSPIEGWSTYQVAYFLDGLFQQEALDSPGGRKALAEVVGERLGMTSNLNAEISFRWSLLVVNFSAVACLPSVEAFLTRQGKQKYQVAVFRALYHNEGGGDAGVKVAMQEFARRVYQQTKPALHANVRKYIAKAMHWTTAGGAEEGVK